MHFTCALCSQGYRWPHASLYKHFIHIAIKYLKLCLPCDELEQSGHIKKVPVFKGNFAMLNVQATIF